MDQLAIQTIENFLQVPLIDPAAIHDLDAKEIAAALGRLEEEVYDAQEQAEEARAEAEDVGSTIDLTNAERLEEVRDLIEEIIANCDLCQARQDRYGCPPHAFLRTWLAEAEA